LPCLRDGKPLLIVGLDERYSAERSAAIPSLWQRFAPYIQTIPGQVHGVTYGVCCNAGDDSNFDYTAGVEVTDLATLPAELTRIRLPEQRYAVFSHREHISSIRRTINTIWNKWLPESGLQAADATSFERYGEAFDPHTGTGGFEIWIPVKA